jgi:hypothetical protein
VDEQYGGASPHSQYSTAPATVLAVRRSHCASRSCAATRSRRYRNTRLPPATPTTAAPAFASILTRSTPRSDSASAKPEELPGNSSTASRCPCGTSRRSPFRHGQRGLLHSFTGNVPHWLRRVNGASTDLACG